MFGWFQSGREDYQPVRSSGSSSDSSPDDAAANALRIGASTAPPAAVPSSPSWMDKIKSFAGLGEPEPPKEKTYAEQFNEACGLTRMQRMYGFGITFVVGWVISLLSLTSVPQIATHPEKFALMYTAGNIVSLCSTAFLWGPCQQLKDMFKPIRIVATIVYILSMALTLFCAFGLKMVAPTILSIVIQMCAMIWYCVSYIPYGQEMLRSCIGGCCDLG